jgi:uncharacterized membrane protein YkvA (DUF1232 family)
MTSQKSIIHNPEKSFSLLTSLIQQVRLTWLLFRDKRVPVWVKAIIPAALLYTLSPIDILPDVFLGLGQLDDIGVLLLGMTSFIKLCPPEIVAYYRGQLAREIGRVDAEVIDTTFRSLDQAE